MLGQVYVKSGNFLKLILFQISVLNLGLLMQSAIEIGTPWELRARGFAFFLTVNNKINVVFTGIRAIEFIFGVSYHQYKVIW